MEKQDPQPQWAQIAGTRIQMINLGSSCVEESVLRVAEEKAGMR